jgi:hypothetical protein
VARGIDDLDESQVRQAAKLLERENERLVRRVLELERTLNTTQGRSVSQMELLADLEHRLAVRDKMLFGKGSEKRGTSKAPGQERAPQTGHGPREQLELAHVERVYELDEADKACTSCDGVLTEMAGQWLQRVRVAQETRWQVPASALLGARPPQIHRSRARLTGPVQRSARPDRQALRRRTRLRK